MSPVPVRPAYLPRTPTDLDDPGLKPEVALAVEGARVIYLNRRALQRDFAELSSEALMARDPALKRCEGPERQHRENEFIEQWLLERGAVISQAQAAQTHVNSPIRTGAKAKAYRPTRYGRSLVVPVGGDDDGPARGLLDVKGAGIGFGVMPQRDNTANGLCELSEALIDLFIQWLVDAIFGLAAPRFSSVSVYAVLDLGFSVIWPDGTATPVGSQLRQAHRRPFGAAEIPPSGSREERLKAHIELLLRSYGITSSTRGTRFFLAERNGSLQVSYGRGPPLALSPTQQQELRRLARFEGGSAEFDAINVQLARVEQGVDSPVQLVDFGQYQITDRFERPVVNLVRERVLRWGAMLRPGERGFVQPHPRVRIDLSAWGQVENPERPMTAFYDEFTRLASSLAAHEIAPAAALGRMQNWFARATSNLGLPRTASSER